MPEQTVPADPTLPRIGWKEWVALPELNLPAVKAKIDTGARTSALHTAHLETFRRDGRDMVRFGVHPLQRRRDVLRTCEAVVLEHRQVKNSGGQVEERYVISTALVIGGMEWTIDITLTNRTGMRFRMLLGRTAVRGRLLIDPGSAYLCGRKHTGVYGVAPVKPQRKRAT